MFFQKLAFSGSFTILVYQYIKQKVCSKNMFSNIQIKTNLLRFLFAGGKQTGYFPCYRDNV